MTWHPENKLEQSLMKAVNDPAHHPQFYKDLVESDLFIVQHGPPPEQSGKTILKEGFQLKIQNIEWNGKPCIPVFSSLPRLQQALQAEAGYIAVNALELMKITLGAEMVLNPGSDFGKEFTRQEIQSIVDGSIWKPAESYRVEKDTQVMMGQPANYPRELADALARLFKGMKEVKRAYLVHFFNPEKDQKPHTLVGIEASGNWDHVAAQAGLVARGVEIPDPPVDFIQITGGSGVDGYFLNECQPFYKRKFLGLF
jgi:SseB protein C-terminal domain/SseB protein N-terminal domain